MKRIQIPFAAKSFFACQHFHNTKKNVLLTFAEEESAIKAYKQLKFLVGKSDYKDTDQLLYFPSLDTLPYDRVSPTPEIATARATVLAELAQNSSQSQKIIVTCAQNLLIKLPPKLIFLGSTIILKPGSKVNIEEVALFLINIGFTRTSSAIETGELAIRGEILDVVSGNVGYRLNFGWEGIESIKEFDVNSQISSRTLDELKLSTANESLINAKTLETFRDNFLRHFGVNHTKSHVFESMMSGRKFQGYEHLMPLLYNDMASLADYLGDFSVIYDNLSIQSMLMCEKSYEDFYQARILANKTTPEAFYFAIPPDKYLINSQIVIEALETGDNFFIEGTNDNTATIQMNIITASRDADTQPGDGILIRKVLNEILANRDKIIIICCSSKSAIQRIKNIIENYDYTTNQINCFSLALKHQINIGICPLSQGFGADNYLFISEQDLLGRKFTSQSHKSRRRKLRNMLTEFDNIDEGALVVHKEHGIGRFEKIETLLVDNIIHDCLKIIYLNNDILYLPVENINLITKYGNDEAELDKLGGIAWQKRKAKLKNRIKDIAAELIKTTAKRELHKASPVNFDPELYTSFCHRFPYSETEDQLMAIKDIEKDLKSGKLADRLICGDVGFGKTEVAMRAAFMVAFDMNDDHPQVAIISPTTILCRQHYQSFTQRFAGMNVNIAQVSRLVSGVKAKQAKEDIENGKINIIIGTQSLLAKNMRFRNLKMIIIDEEQHFGVTQKEHLKSLKAAIHVLSLSATPIPRTLQMSMSGLKDLSLITTPPIDRLPVRTTVIPFDGVIVRDALMREKSRGGKSFYVVPRISELEWVAKKLQEYVPELSFKVAHGQMPATELDKVMNEFCDGKFDILLSTTIIESGIDIVSANTIIIHRADRLGLSQLYQLRGRVGRGKIRGYAYLTLLNDKLITKHSWARLEVLQNIDSLGAGFTIATHDMDLRGFGNLVGEEQSGHIREVGSELYQEMLDEAIAELKNQNAGEKNPDFTPSINLGTSIYIPQSYIEDSALRLAIYRRAADLKDNTEIENFRDEMVDRFGPVPLEFSNLLELVRIKHQCLALGIENLDSGTGGFVLKFSNNFDVSDMVMAFVSKFPRHAKVKPDNKLVFLKNLQGADPLVEAEKLLKIIEDCQPSVL